MMDQARGSRERTFFWIFAAMVAAFCLWVLSLPLVPTQDGPIHLYLATIFRGLLRHSAGNYGQYYLVRHYLPPYSFQYYFLVGSMGWVSLLTAEKIFVCLILVCFGFGFRYLATGIGENGRVLAFFGLCLLLNWSLAMGFENYLFSLGLAFWALGLWMRMGIGNAPGKRVGFLVLLAWMALTHPVPVAIVLGFAGLDVVVQTALSRNRGREEADPPRRFGLDVATIIAGASVLLYVSAFTEKARTAGNIRHTIYPLAELRSFYGHLEGLRYFGGTWWNGRAWPVDLYNVAMYLLVVVAALLVLRGWKRLERRGITWRIAFVSLLVLMPIVPMDMNGSHMFAPRLVILVWLAGFAAASGKPRLPRNAETGIVVLGCGIALGILILAQRDVSREARQIAEITAAPSIAPGRLGLLLPGLEEHVKPAYALVTDPFVWAGVHFFRQNGEVLLNTPWMDIPILPVNAKPALGIGAFSPLTVEFFYEMRKQIEDGDPDALRLLSRADFILFTTGGETVRDAAVTRILEAQPGSRWSCGLNSSWSELCVRQR